MKDDTLSFKEKYLRLRERFDRVSTTQRQYTNDLQAARLKTRKLREENNHLLDLLSEIQQMTGSGPSSDSDTSMEDLDDLNDSEDEEMNEEGQSDKHHHNGHGIGRSPRKTTDSSRKDIPTDDGGSLPPEPHRIAGLKSTTRDGLDVEHCEQKSILPQSSNNNGTVSINNGATAANTRKKRADRGQPRLVVPLKTNPDGSLNYPIVVGKGTNEVIIENMGRIVWNGRGYHNHRYIFPVGFRSKKQYTSLSDTSKKTYFISEILDGGDQPIFQITLEDMPEKVFRHSSSSGAWELALKGLMELGFNAKTHASGPDMYGLTNLGVIKYIQEMPNANRCRRYMPLKWIIDEDNVEGGSPDSSSQGFKTYDGKTGTRRKRFNNSLYASNHDVLLSTMEEAAAASAAASASASASTSSQKMLTAPSPRPYTPRKYTRRKANDSVTTGDPTPLSSPPPQATLTSPPPQSSFTSPPPHDSAGSYSEGYHSSGYDREEHEQEGVRQQYQYQQQQQEQQYQYQQHEQQYQQQQQEQQYQQQQQQQIQHHIARATTPLPSTVTTAAAAAAMPRSVTGQGPYYPERFPSHPPQSPLSSINKDSLQIRDHYDPYQQPVKEP
ncbi:transforming growth factor beta regulator 1 [Linnemannia zychae]|nr:transforming growth factor beta regulator 1 [Linnemannia zychae]